MDLQKKIYLALQIECFLRRETKLLRSMSRAFSLKVVLFENKEIANIFQRQLSTIKSHCTNTYRKLESGSHKEALYSSNIILLGIDNIVSLNMNEENEIDFGFYKILFGYYLSKTGKRLNPYKFMNSKNTGSVVCKSYPELFKGFIPFDRTQSFEN